MSLGKNIAKFRKEKGWTQGELGEKLGVSNQAVSKWEREISCPDIILLPSLAKAFQKARGFMFPFGWWHLLKALKWNDTQTSEMLLVAVKPEYQGKGAVALIFDDIIPVHARLGFKYSESNPELEANTKIQSQWDYFERENHKRRRAYMKRL